MAGGGCEYRVRWRREGRAMTSRIYQTETAARYKIDGILALEEIKDDAPRWKNMPDLVSLPTLQFRAVGSWLDAEPGAQLQPSNTARMGVREWMGFDDQYD